LLQADFLQLPCLEVLNVVLWTNLHDFDEPEQTRQARELFKRANLPRLRQIEYSVVELDDNEPASPGQPCRILVKDKESLDGTPRTLTNYGQVCDICI